MKRAYCIRELLAIFLCEAEAPLETKDGPRMYLDSSWVG